MWTDLKKTKNKKTPKAQKCISINYNVRFLFLKLSVVSVSATLRAKKYLDLYRPRFTEVALCNTTDFYLMWVNAQPVGFFSCIKSYIAESHVQHNKWRIEIIAS